MRPLRTPEKNGAEERDVERLYSIIKEDIATQSTLYFTPLLSTDKEPYKNAFPDEVEITNIVQNIPEVGHYFKIHEIIGRGTFGTVFLAYIKGDCTKKKFALKHLIPTSHPRRIAFELNCMKNIGGTNNVAGVQIALRYFGNIVFVMDYQHHEPFSSYIHQLDVSETALYIKNLLIALTQVHKFKIIHRDIKPSNFLYDRKKKTFLLIDFGLAQEIDKFDRKKTNGQNNENIKRKRDPLSPMSNILQSPKRPALNSNHENAQNSTIKITFQTKLRYTSINKENDEQHLTQKASNPIKSRIQTQNNWTIKVTPTMKDNTTQECQCYGKAKMCSMCSVRPAIKASRAGTPGYRPPEVLFQYPKQTTAVDVWAAGIILLSILSNSINFFESPNDIAAIAELITIFGFDSMKKVACICGRFLICNEKKPKLDIRKICCILRNRPNNSNLITSATCVNCNQPTCLCICLGTPMHNTIIDAFPTEAYELLMKLLDINPNTRINAVEALKHPFLNKCT